MLSKRDGSAPEPGSSAAAAPASGMAGRHRAGSRVQSARGDSTSVPMGSVVLHSVVSVGCTQTGAPRRPARLISHRSVQGRRRRAHTPQLKAGSQGTLWDLTAQGLRSCLTPTRALSQPSGSCKRPIWCEAGWFQLCVTLDSTAGRARCRGTVRSHHESEVEISHCKNVHPSLLDCIGLGCHGLCLDKALGKHSKSCCLSALPPARPWSAAGHVRAAGMTLASLSETRPRTIQMKAIPLFEQRRLPAPSAAVGGTCRWKLFGSGRICGH